MVRDVSTALDMTEERQHKHVFTADRWLLTTNSCPRFISLPEIDEKMFAIKYELSYISR
jgi:hypothetical protein